MTLRSAAPPPTVLRRVAREIVLHWVHPAFSETLGSPSRSGTRHAIAETFELWAVDRAAMQNAPMHSTLNEIARPTSRWHHQIVAAGGEPIAFARSSRHPGALGKHVELEKSAVAAAVGEGISWLDAHVRRDATVRLLEIPSQLVQGLWIVPDAPKASSNILILSAAARLRLPRDRLLTAHDLITATRK